MSKESKKSSKSSNKKQKDSTTKFAESVGNAIGEGGLGWGSMESSNKESGTSWGW